MRTAEVLLLALCEIPFPTHACCEISTVATSSGLLRTSYVIFQTCESYELARVNPKILHQLHSMQDAQRMVRVVSTLRYT